MENTESRGNKEEFDEVAEVVATCRIHWRIVDVPDDRADEMEQELEDHLREAVENGRSVEDVVGDDEIAFADSWAKEARERRSILGWIYEIGWAFAGGVAFTAVVYHLFRWSLTFQVETEMFVPVLLFTWFAGTFRLLPSRTEKQRNDPEWVKWIKGFARAFVVITPLVWAPIIISWAITGERNAELFGWSWLYTLVALVAATGLGRLAKKDVGQK